MWSSHSKKYFLILSIACNTALAAEITVNSDKDDGSDGAACSLREAVALANASASSPVNNDCGSQSAASIDTIVFSPTVSVIYLNDGQLKLTDELIVDGGTQGVIIDAQYRSQIFKIEVGNAPLTVRNLTLKRGRGLNGGAIKTQSNLTIEQSTLSRNYNYNNGDGGAAVSGSAGRLTITNSLFTDNDSNKSGGAVRWIGDGITITNSSFTDNNAFELGGAIYAKLTGDFEINHSTFANNSAAYQSASTQRGGAIYAELETAEMSIINSTFYENGGNPVYGGAILSYALGLNVANSTFLANNAVQGGAIYSLFPENSSLTLSSNLFLDNVAGVSDKNCTINPFGSPNGFTAQGSNNLWEDAADACAGVTGITGALSDIVANMNGKAVLADNGCVTKAGMPATAKCVKTIKLIRHLDGTTNPAVDAGLNSGSSAGTITTDQRGVELNGMADIGAFESDELKLTITTPVNNGSVSSQTMPSVGKIENCSNTPADCEALFAKNTDIMLTAMPDSGYAFKQWANCATQTDKALTLTLTENQTCEAVFNQIPVIQNVPNTPESIVTVIENSLSDITIADDGAVTVTLTAVGGKLIDDGTEKSTLVLTANDATELNDLNTMLAALKFKTAQVGNASITIDVADNDGQIASALYMLDVERYDPDSAKILLDSFED